MWLEAEKQLLEGLITLMKTGGQYGMYALGLWITFELIKFLTIGGIVWGIITRILATIRTMYTLRCYSKQQSITLLSKECTAHLEKAITDYSERSQGAVTELIKHVKDLEENSKKTTNQTV